MKTHKICITALMAAFVASSVTHAATFTVQMQNNFFNPATLNIKQGDTVIWVASAAGHDTESYDGLWSSPILNRGQSFPHTFTEPPGSYRYKCNPHEGFGMIGTINVAAAENTPPTVSVTSPANGATLIAGEIITFTATATDNGSVTQVEFFANGNSVGSANTSPFGITSTLAAGNYAITARATDNLGASTTSAAVNITVNAANTPPTVTLTSPSEGATFTADQSISLAANATDNGRVTSVEFFANSVSVGKATSSPFEVSATLAAGSYAITARATDNLGASTTSSGVNITVNAATQNQPPTVTISANPTLMASGATLKLIGAASDSDGTIAKVEFFNGAALAGEKATSPYEIELPNMAAGLYSFTAVATDNQGAKTTSGVLEVRVAAEPKIDSIQHNESGTTLQITGTPGILHTMEGSTDLANWTTVGTVTPTNGPATLTDSSTGQLRFYRILVK